MSAELVGILSVGATLVVGGLATAGAVVGLILRLENRLSARMDAMDGRLSDRMDRLSARMGRISDRIERLSARMDRLNARMDQLEARMERLVARMNTLEARQYELVQVIARMEATQQAMLATLSSIEQRTRPAGDPSGQPALAESGSPAVYDPRPSAPASAPAPA